MSGRSRRPGRWIALALGLVVGLGAATKGPALLERWNRRRALARAIEALERPSTRETDSPFTALPPEEALVAFDDPEAVLALVKRLGQPTSDPSAVLRAVELFALEPEPRDPRVREALEALARDGSDDPRCAAFSFLSELERPRHAREPEGFAPPGARVVWDFAPSLFWSAALEKAGVTVEPGVVHKLEQLDGDVDAGTGQRGKPSFPRIEDSIRIGA